MPLILLLLLCAGLAAGEARDHLPDRSEGLAGRLGPFLWARATDTGADARFCDEVGAPDPDGERLWLYQFTRLNRERSPLARILERNNLESLDPAIAYDVALERLLINCDEPHNFKLVFGYKQRAARFEHGDNADLAHLVDADRLCVYLPIRLRRGGDPHDPADYHVNTVYQGQSFCVVEFAAGELIRYDWFRGAGDLDPHVLFDLVPFVDAHPDWRPLVHRPLMRLRLGEEAGAWELLIELDGRDGLAGGDVDGDWDARFTHASDGAAAATVDVGRDGSCWALSTFSPGGRPEETSEAVVRLRPFDRATGALVPWPDRTPRVRTAPLTELEDGD